MIRIMKGLRNVNFKNISILQHRTLKELAPGIKYLPDHEWLLTKGDLSTIGLAQSGAEQLGELVYIDYPVEKGDIIDKETDLVILESVKASDSIIAPFNCEIVEINEEHDLEYINENPECREKSWLVKMKKIA